MSQILLSHHCGRSIDGKTSYRCEVQHLPSRRRIHHEVGQPYRGASGEDVYLVFSGGCP